MVHDARIIPLDGSAHLPDSVRQWKGDSRGRWMGDTLVVETRNFTAKTQFPRIGNRSCGWRSGLRGPTPRR